MPVRRGGCKEPLGGSVAAGGSDVMASGRKGRSYALNRRGLPDDRQAEVRPADRGSRPPETTYVLWKRETRQ
jgi:hypothetical protein